MFFSFVSAMVFKVIKYIKSKTYLKAGGILNTALTPPGAIFCFLDFTFYFIFSLTSSLSQWVLLDVCTLLQLGLGLNFGMSLSLQVDWRLGCSQGQLGSKKMFWHLNTLMATTLKVP